MQDLLNEFLHYFSSKRMLLWGTSLALLVVGMLLSRLLAFIVARVAQHSTGPRQAAVLRRLSYYAFLVMTWSLVLGRLGFDLKVLLGAAGVLTVAVGFASQTSASNIISGLFLLGERPFMIGDFIQIDQIVGEVISIDLLSVRIRTYDNLAVRVPNETLLKTSFTNLTHFPIRRLDMHLGVSYREDIEHVREVLMAVGDANPLCLDEPKPVFLFNGFQESSLSVQFSVWGTRENYWDLHTSMYIDVRRAFDAEEIVIPYPQRTLHINRDGGDDVFSSDSGD